MPLREHLSKKWKQIVNKYCSLVLSYSLLYHVPKYDYAICVVFVYERIKWTVIVALAGIDILVCQRWCCDVMWNLECILAWRAAILCSWTWCHTYTLKFYFNAPNKLGHPWLVSVSSQYQKLCWIIVYWTLRNKIPCNLNTKTIILLQESANEPVRNL